MTIYDLIIALCSGILTSLVATRIERKSKKRELREKYGRCAGKYEGFCFEDGKLKSKPDSDAVVTYDRDNILKLRLTEKAGSVWEGILTMETEDNGTVVWQYVAPEGRCEFGFKRCIWNGKDRIFLVGEKLDGFGQEVLIKHA
jgi:hypothetical protein